MRSVVRRLRGTPKPKEPHYSFGTWGGFARSEPRVVQVCHPDWRGVRTATYAFRTPVIEVDDLNQWGEQLLGELRAAEVALVVIQGWPPGSAGFARLLRSDGIEVKCVLHSSPTQHGGESVEEMVANAVLQLAGEGVLAEVGMVKAGLAEAFQTAGYPVRYVPNRKPAIPEHVQRTGLGSGFHVGVLGGSIWRKNLVTQVLAAGMLDDAVIHVLQRPSVDYVANLRIVEHGVQPWEAFLGLAASVDLNLYVSLSECHPLLPVESYLMGVPCLVSRTSSLFSDGGLLWELTTVDRLDDPTAIAEKARQLIGRKDEALRLANEWIDSEDQVAEAAWKTFIGPRATP